MEMQILSFEEFKTDAWEKMKKAKSKTIKLDWGLVTSVSFGAKWAWDGFCDVDLVDFVSAKIQQKGSLKYSIDRIGKDTMILEINTEKRPWE